MRKCLISLSYHLQRSTPIFKKLFHSCRTQLPSNSVVCITVSGNRLMVYSHCMGMGQGPLQGPNGKYSIMQKCSHLAGTGTKAHCLLLCQSPVLFTCSVNMPLNVTCKLETNVSRMAFPCSVNEPLDKHIHGVFAFTIPVWFLLSLITYHHILPT